MSIPSPEDDLEATLARINANLAASAPGLKSFGEEIVIIARRTETPTLEIAFKAAEELARQGLGRQELLKRLEVALLLAHY